MVNMYIYIIDQARGQDEKSLDILLKTLSKTIECQKWNWPLLPQFDLIVNILRSNTVIFVINTISKNQNIHIYWYGYEIASISKMKVLLILFSDAFMFAFFLNF